MRFIGDAATRIAEDYLRILRFFRFHAYYGEGHPDAEGLHAAIAARAGLEQLSRERVRMELMKLLLAPHAVPVLAVMAEAGLLGSVLGGVPHLASFANMAKVEAAVGVTPDATRRLGALGVWVAEDAERLWQRLRLSNAEHERLAALDGWWRVSPAMSEASARELIYRIGPEHFTERVLLAWARSWNGARRCGVARSCDATAALERAGVSAQGRRLHRARRRERAIARRGIGARRGGLDQVGLSDGAQSAPAIGDHQRCAAAADAVRYSAACMVATSSAPACMVAATSR